MTIGKWKSSKENGRRDWNLIKQTKLHFFFSLIEWKKWFNFKFIISFSHLHINSRKEIHKKIVKRVWTKNGKFQRYTNFFEESWTIPVNKFFLANLLLVKEEQFFRCGPPENSKKNNNYKKRTNFRIM